MHVSSSSIKYSRIINQKPLTGHFLFHIIALRKRDLNADIITNIARIILFFHGNSCFGFDWILAVLHDRVICHNFLVKKKVHFIGLPSRLKNKTGNSVRPIVLS